MIGSAPRYLRHGFGQVAVHLRPSVARFPLARLRPVPHTQIAVRFSSTGPDNKDITGVSLPASDIDTSSGASVTDNLATAVAGAQETVNGLITSPDLSWFNPVDVSMTIIENIHHFADVPYWQAIIAFTVGIRFCLLPIALKGVQNGNRMAFLKPDMEKVQNAMKANEGTNDPKMQARYQMEMKELFKKHNVNPFKAVALPFLQMPIFISLFMALRQMQDYFPDYCNGGALWFTDLSAADPTYALPIFNAVSFLLMIELGADGMDQANKGMFKNFMRAMAVFMVPLTYSMPQV